MEISELRHFQVHNWSCWSSCSLNSNRLWSSCVFLISGWPERLPRNETSRMDFKVIPFLTLSKQRGGSEIPESSPLGTLVNPRTLCLLSSHRVVTQGDKDLRIQTPHGFCLKILRPLSLHCFLVLLFHCHLLKSRACAQSKSLWTSSWHSRIVLINLFAI